MPQPTPPTLPPLNRDQRLDQMARIGVPICDSLNYPAELMLAQWAGESEWGAKHAGRNNVFGMTRAARHKQWEWVPTSEELTEAGISNLDPDERARITSKKKLPNGNFDVKLSRRFAAFDSIDEAIHDQLGLIMSVEPYATAFRAYRKTGDLATLVLAVARVYATSSRYPAMILAISKQFNIARAIRANRPPRPAVVS